MPSRTFQLQAPKGLWPLTWPMGLTLLRLFLLPLFLWVMLLDSGQRHLLRPHRWWAMGIFAVMAITDKLDGYLARKLGQTSTLGTLLDPVADKLLIACSTILLSFDTVAPAPYAIPLPVVIAVYGKDLIVAAGAVILLSLIRTVTIRPRLLGKLSTFLQLSLVIATLIAPDFARLRTPLPRQLLATLWWSVSVVAVGSCVDYLWQGWLQFRSHRQAAPASPAP